MNTLVSALIAAFVDGAKITSRRRTVFGSEKMCLKLIFLDVFGDKLLSRRADGRLFHRKTNSAVLLISAVYATEYNQ